MSEFLQTEEGEKPRRFFARLLTHHMKSGTRPNKTAVGIKRWTDKTLSEIANCNPQLVNAWRNRGVRPNQRRFDDILDAFFGAETDLSADVDQLRQQLIAAYNAVEAVDRRMQTKDGANLAFGVFGSTPALLSDMPPDVWKCYKSLFPHEDERDEPHNILNWLEQARSDFLGSQSHEWAELFFTLSVDKTCVGMAFLSLYRPSAEHTNRPTGWWFGNYFGILDGWRYFGTAARFLRFIERECLRIQADAKGIVFEVERYDEKQIDSALSKLERAAGNPGTAVRLTAKEIFSVRAARRIALYTGKSLKSEENQTRRTIALSVASRENGEFEWVDYTQPSMKKPNKRGESISPKNEVDLWLMVYPLAGLRIESGYGKAHPMNAVDVSDLFNFIYGEVFPSAYAKEHDSGAAEDSGIAGFNEYVESVYKRIMDPLRGKQLYLVSTLMLSENAKKIVRLHGSKLDELGLSI